MLQLSVYCGKVVGPQYLWAIYETTDVAILKRVLRSEYGTRRMPAFPSWTWKHDANTWTAVLREVTPTD